MNDQRTPGQLQAARRGQIAATLKREQREAAEAREQALGGRLKARMKAKSARPDEVPPWCYLTDGRSPEEAAANAAHYFDITVIEALAMVWTLRRALLTAFSEPGPYVGIGGTEKAAEQPLAHADTETISAHRPANTEPMEGQIELPTIDPAKNRSTHQGETA